MKNFLNWLKSTKINIFSHMRNKKISSKNKRILLLKIKPVIQQPGVPNLVKNSLIDLNGLIDQKQRLNLRLNLKNHVVAVVMYLKERILKLDTLSRFYQKCPSLL